MEGSFTEKSNILFSPGQSSFYASDGCCVLYLVAGALSVRVGKTQVDCMHNDILLLRDGEVAELHNTGELPTVVLAARIASGYAGELSNGEEDLRSCFLHPQLSKYRRIPQTSQNNMLVRALLERLDDDSQQGLFAYALHQKSVVIMMLVLLNRDYYENLATPSGSARHLTMDEIFIYVSKHLQDDLTLDNIADELYFSKYHILHEFKKQTGRTLHRYIVTRKLQYAKSLLEQGLPVIEVYKSCGFGDYSHFFRAFKREFGVTPKQHYRSFCQNKNGDTTPQGDAAE